MAGSNGATAQAPANESANGSSDARSRQLSVGIVGAGFGGLGMGIRLTQAGNRNFTIFERGGSVGGVWRANTYPGAACDVPSHLYSFSFAHGHNWTRRYAPQPDILEYMEGLVERFDLRQHLRLETEVTDARFDESEGEWEVMDSHGVTHRFDVLVTACGQLTNPLIPEIEGMGDFGGPVFHSAEWDHSVDLAGKKVAVIGTGASAIQFVPVIAEQAEQIDIYQRSAPWIVPKFDRRYPDLERKFFRAFPPRVAASRGGLFGFFEMATHAFTGRPELFKPFLGLAESARKKIDDPVLREKVTPDYDLGCKRVLFTSDWYPALARDDVELHDGEPERVTGSGLVGPDGVEREADVIIYGTGFRSNDFVAPMDVHGLGDRDLNEVWQDRPEAYLGTTIPGFPNLFILYGPNTNHGSGSVPYTLECQFNYALDAIERIERGGLRYIDLKPEVLERWRQEVDERSLKSVWVTGGCSNWYVNEEGVNTNNWVGGWLEYRRRTARIRPGEYRAVV